MLDNTQGAFKKSYLCWKGWQPEMFGVFSKRDSRYYSWHINRIFGTQKELRVLEIGFGNGAFLGWLKRHGHEATGIEVNTDLVRLALQKRIMAYPKIEDIPDGALFDLIAGFDVIEHIPTDELPNFFTKLRHICSPSGRLIFRFPNGDSPLGLPHQNGDLTHVTAIGLGKIKQLAAMTGWQIVMVGEAPWWADQVSPRNLRTAVRHVLRNLFESLLGFMYVEGMDFGANLVVVMKPADLH